MSLYFEDVAEAAELPALSKQPTPVQLFRYSAAVWNSHRLHYDQPFAAAEGHAGVLVQGPLHGAFLVQMVQEWAGPLARLRRLEFSNRRPAVAGQTLTCRGRVERKYEAGGQHLVECQVWEENEAGEVCARGRIVMQLPLRSPAPR